MGIIKRNSSFNLVFLIMRLFIRLFEGGTLHLVTDTEKAHTVATQIYRLNWKYIYFPNNVYKGKK